MTTGERWLVVAIATIILSVIGHGMNDPIIPFTLLVFFFLWALTSVDTSGDIECFGPPPWDPVGEPRHYTIRDGREIKTIANLRDDKRSSKEVAKRNITERSVNECKATDSKTIEHQVDERSITESKSPQYNADEYKVAERKAAKRNAAESKAARRKEAEHRLSTMATRTEE